jgi:hypothetical protein
MTFLGLLDAPEGAPGRQPRFLGRQAATPVLVFEKGEVRVDFAQELPLGSPRPQQGEQAGGESPPGGHRVRAHRAAAC